MTLSRLQSNWLGGVAIEVGGVSSLTNLYNTVH